VGVTGRRAGMPAHYAEHEPGVLDIFFEYSLKRPRICSNMLEYTQIYSIFPCRVGVEVYWARRASGRSEQAGGRTDNHV
jgi:hypothetical protein